MSQALMIKLLALLVVVFGTFAAAAQDEDFKRAEFFAGYSYGSAAVNFGFGPLGQRVYEDRVGKHGFNASGVVNLSRYVGIKGDFSGAYRNDRFSFAAPSSVQSIPTVTVQFEAKTSLYNVLGGVQVKDNASDARLKPFAHAMVGVAHRRNVIQGGPFACITIIPCPGDRIETGFAGAFGGGLDVRLGKRVAFRLVQIDYNPARFETGTDHNFRFSTGFVF